ncbi:MAG: CDGSH iron-sulfur domain-containing protein [Flavobacteriaceae bacterium]|nr:CDGSH iron-sulfur domain-containing protein [Flavobacteriaceae bacterium]MDG2502873.1 CDGSH iron-sulfur domain-containing protein [Flavobacteriaceae bacterium]
MKDKRTHIFRKSKGQIVIDGHVKLTDEEGKEVPHGDRFTLCGCGRSQKLPFCDGTHKEI